MRLSSIRFLAPLATALTLARCTTEACGCPPSPATAQIYGRVTSPTAEPVPGALVRAYSAPAQDCHTDGVGGSDYGVMPARTDGTFRMGLPGGDERDSICVFVFARPPTDSDGGLTVSDTTLVVLSFRYGVPQDSARVDPVLRVP
jgi:hypothetical protein